MFKFLWPGGVMVMLGTLLFMASLSLFIVRSSIRITRLESGAAGLTVTTPTPEPPGTGIAFSQAQQAPLTWQECDRALAITDRARSIHAAYRNMLKLGPDSMKSYPVRDVSYRNALQWEVSWTEDYNFLAQLFLRLCQGLPVTIRGVPAER